MLVVMQPLLPWQLVQDHPVMRAEQVALVLQVILVLQELMVQVQQQVVQLVLVLQVQT